MFHWPSCGHLVSVCTRHNSLYEMEYLTHQLDGIPAAMVRDELKSQLFARAKMAVAFLGFHSPAALPATLCAAGLVQHLSFSFGHSQEMPVLDRWLVHLASGTDCSC